MKIGRNPDFAEIEVEGLKFAKAYGFRNIQSLMQKMKRGKFDYDCMCPTRRSYVYVVTGDDCDCSCGGDGLSEWMSQWRWTTQARRWLE